MPKLQITFLRSFVFYHRILFIFLLYSRDYWEAFNKNSKK